MNIKGRTSSSLTCTVCLQYVYEVRYSGKNATSHAVHTRMKACCGEIAFNAMFPTLQAILGALNTELDSQKWMALSQLYVAPSIFI